MTDYKRGRVVNMDFTEIHQKVSSSDQGKFWLDLNPMTKLIMVLCGVAASIIMPGFVFGFVWAVLLLIFSCTCGKGKQMGATMLFIFAVFVIIMVTARAFFYDGDSPILWSAGRFSIKLYGIYRGLHSSNIILGFSSSLVFFYLTTDAETLMLELEKHRVSPRATFVILTTFQMIPQMSENSKAIQNAQKARGIETEGNILIRAKAFLPMFMPLLLSAFTMAEEKTLALETRGFNSSSTKTRIRIVKDSKKQKMVRIAIVAVTVIACVGGGYFRWLA